MSESEGAVGLLFDCLGIYGCFVLGAARFRTIADGNFEEPLHPQAGEWPNKHARFTFALGGHQYNQTRTRLRGV